MTDLAGQLIQKFWLSIPDRVAECTNLLLTGEQGDADALRTLQRLLHSIKGEAQMFSLDDCAQVAQVAEGLLQAITETGVWPASAGNALLASFERFGMLAPRAGGAAAEFGIDDICQQLEAALAEVWTTEGESPTTPDRGADETSASAPEGLDAGAAPTAAQRSAGMVPVEAIEPLTSELRRLYAEQAVLYPQLREVQRMLRILLKEIDPRAPPDVLVERIVKTLGFGGRIERRLGLLGAEWSANEFSTSQVIERLEEHVREASVVPLTRLTMQIHRAVRGAAQTLGRLVDVEVLGDQSLDAAVERRLGPTLIQLVRNATDHGIEPPEERVAAGKDERGRITVQIVRTESTVRATVHDDGRGIDFERLREKLAGDRGDAAQLDQQTLLQAIFEPGVTTRDEATEISGRGVGLDIVANEVASAGGRISTESSPSLGTRFTILMPASLRTEMVIPVRSGGIRCAISARLVRGIVRVRELETTSRGTFMRAALDGVGDEALFRVASLATLLGEAGDAAVGEAALIVDHPQGAFALSVDDYEDPRPLAGQPVEDELVRTPFVQGVLPSPDGGVLLLVDVGALQVSIQRHQGGTDDEQPMRRRHILVVEDAPIARALLCGLLRSFGYRVSAAMDGQEGLSIAHRDRPDVILTDIEMPVMDGLQMIEAIRTDAQLQHVPIAVLTTRGDDETHARADELGVRRFISKRHFVESELRDIIEGFFKESG